MSWLAAGAASLLGALLSAMGMGGGGVLLMYLTAYAGYDQLSAQGINLVFFVPVALIAIYLHAKKGLVRWRLVPPCVILGLAGVYLGAQLAMFIGSGPLSRLFGGFLALVGIRELFAGKGRQSAEENGRKNGAGSDSGAPSEKQDRE